MRGEESTTEFVERKARNEAGFAEVGEYDQDESSILAGLSEGTA